MTVEAPPTHTVRRRSRAPKNGRILGIGTALALAIVPMLGSPALANAEQRPVDSRSATAFTAKVQTEVFIGADVQPSDFVAPLDGATGLVTTRTDSTLHFLDLAAETVTGSIALPAEGGRFIELSPDGAAAYLVLSDGQIAVVDLATRSLARSFASSVRYPQRLAVSADGERLYALGLDGQLARLDPADGTVLAKGQVPGTNYHGLTFAADGAELLVGGEKVIQVVGADDLTIQRAIALPNFTSVGDLSYDTDPSRLYVSDSTGSRLGVLDPASGVLLASAPVGNPMAMIVGSDEHNRAYGNVPYWDMIMSANFDTGARSESYRATPTAPFSLSSNPATGDLLSANAGWSNGVKGSTVSIVYAPGVTDPADVAITALEGEAVFTTAVTGIKPRGGGALQWQSSDDGVEWADVPGATGDELAVAVNAETLAQSYRVRWSDAFWGASGESAAARIVTPAPAITLDTPLPAGVVGEAYEDTAITASGQADLQWSVDGMTRTTPGLPVGLALDPATGVLSGTPEAEGDYVLTVTVTDVFGSDTREFPLTVTANAAVTPPVTPPVAPPVTPPGTSNPDTSNPDTTGPDTTNPDTTAPGATDDAQPGTSGSADAPAQTQAGAGSAQLAQTGAADPLWLLGAGLVLLGFGAVIVLRRRTTAR